MEHYRVNQMNTLDTEYIEVKQSKWMYGWMNEQIDRAMEVVNITLG